MQPEPHSPEHEQYRETIPVKHWHPGMSEEERLAMFPPLPKKEAVVTWTPPTPVAIKPQPAQQIKRGRGRPPMPVRPAKPRPNRPNGRPTGYPAWNRIDELTPERAMELRAKGLTFRQISKEFGASATLISQRMIMEPDAWQIFLAQDEKLTTCPNPGCTRVKKVQSPMCARCMKAKRKADQRKAAPKGFFGHLKDQAIALHNEGKRIAEIAGALGCRWAVARYLITKSTGKIGEVRTNLLKERGELGIPHTRPVSDESIEAKLAAESAKMSSAENPSASVEPYSVAEMRPEKALETEVKG